MDGKEDLQWLRSSRRHMVTLGGLEVYFVFGWCNIMLGKP
jgi:hypothetical protein